MEGAIHHFGNFKNEETIMMYFLGTFTVLLAIGLVVAIFRDFGGDDKDDSDWES